MAVIFSVILFVGLVVNFGMTIIGLLSGDRPLYEIGFIGMVMCIILSFFL